MSGEQPIVGDDPGGHQIWRRMLGAAAELIGVHTALPEYLPILNARMAGADYRPSYQEREITQAVDLCDRHGRLNPDAIGWSRRPLVRANLSGHWPRKKRWNFWNWICPRFVFSVTLADIDYAAFCQVSFTDFTTKQSVSATSLARPHSFSMPERVEETVSFRSRTMQYVNANHGGELTVEFAGTLKNGERIVAQLVVRTPPEHETLNIVVPWTSTRFQLNSKSNTLLCAGHVTIGTTRYAADPAECHAVQDFGRGMWPYRSFWNWAVCTGVQDGHLIGVNLGGKWTTGTGANENGICFNGRIFKIMEDVRWRYDAHDWMQPWHVCAEHSGMVDLTLYPIVAHRPMINVGVLRSGGVCCFGRWRGTIRFDGDEVLIRDLVGWAEEFDHRW